MALSPAHPRYLQPAEGAAGCLKTKRHKCTEERRSLLGSRARKESRAERTRRRISLSLPSSDGKGSRCCLSGAGSRSLRRPGREDYERGRRSGVQTLAPSLCKSVGRLRLAQPQSRGRGLRRGRTGRETGQAAGTAELAAEEEWQETAPAPNLGSPTSPAREEGEASEAEGEPPLPPREPSRGRRSPARLRGVGGRAPSPGFFAGTKVSAFRLLEGGETRSGRARRQRLPPPTHTNISLQRGRRGLARSPSTIVRGAICGGVRPPRLSRGAEMPEDTEKASLVASSSRPFADA